MLSETPDEAEAAIVLCASAPEYAACALDAEAIRRRLGRPFVPLLAPSPADASLRLALERAPYKSVPFHACAAAAPGPPDELLARLLAAAPSAPPGPLWAVSSATEWGLVGAAFAVARGRRVVALDALDAGAAGARSLALVLSPHECQAIGCDGLVSLAVGALQGAGRWGVLTASSPARLSNLLARTALRPRPTSPAGLLFQQADCATSLPQIDGLERAVMPWHPYEGVGRLAKAGVPFVTFVGHGRLYCAMAGNLCSRSAPADAGDRRCAGDFECMFSSHRRTPARDLRADVVFIDSCSTSAFRSPGPEEAEALNLSVHLLDGFASAVIGPYRTSMPALAAPYLAWSHVRSATSAGATTAALNALVASHFRCAEPFLLFGDPEMVFGAAPAEQPAAALEREAPGRWGVGLPREPRRLVSFLVRDAEVARAVRERALNILSEDSAANDFFQALPLDGDRVELLVLWGDAPPGPVRVHLTTRPAVRPEVIDIATDLLEARRVYRAWLRRPLAGEGEVAPPGPGAELAERLEAMQWAIVNDTPTASTAAFLRLYQLDQELLALCEQSQLDLLSRLRTAATRRSLWLFHELAEAGAVRRLGDELEAEPCPYCGGPVVAHVSSVGLWPAQTRRLLECERCMFLCDVEGAGPRLQIECAEVACKGAPLRVDVVGRNPKGRAALVHAAVSVDTAGAVLELNAVSPAFRFATLGPAEPFRLGFEVRLGSEMMSHVYYLKAVAFVNGSAAWAMRKVTVKGDRATPEALQR